jgi:hypothetical protein
VGQDPPLRAGSSLHLPRSRSRRLREHRRRGGRRDHAGDKGEAADSSSSGDQLGRPGPGTAPCGSGARPPAPQGLCGASSSAGAGRRCYGRLRRGRAASGKLTLWRRTTAGRLYDHGRGGRSAASCAAWYGAPWSWQRELTRSRSRPRDISYCWRWSVSHSWRPAAGVARATTSARWRRRRVRQHEGTGPPRVAPGATCTAPWRRRPLPSWLQRPSTCRRRPGSDRPFGQPRSPRTGARSWPAPSSSAPELCTAAQLRRKGSACGSS